MVEPNPGRPVYRTTFFDFGVKSVARILADRSVEAWTRRSDFAHSQIRD